MYQPPLFQETDPNTLQALIRAHPLGLLISSSPDGPVADPVPFLLDPQIGGHGRLRAHVARANPHWKLVASQPASPVLVVFQGAGSYISPSWYATKRETGKVVPTWNYVTVQVTGIAHAIEDPSWLAEQINDLTRFHEGGRAEPWHVSDAPDAYIAAQIRGIVGIDIQITSIAGKWKISQNRPEADRVGVADGLAESVGGEAMASLVRSRHARS